MAWKQNENILDEEREWNMNQAFLMRLDIRCNERDVAAIEGNVLKWYRTLRAIFRNVHFKLIEAGHEEKEKAILETFERIKIKLLNSRMFAPEQIQNNFNAIEVELDDLDIQLNDLLHKYKFIYPEQVKHNPGEVVRDAF